MLVNTGSMQSGARDAAAEAVAAAASVMGGAAAAPPSRAMLAS
jgi:hypothetical protein